MIRRPPRSTLFPSRRSSDLPSGLWSAASHRNVWHLNEDPGPGGFAEIKDSTLRSPGTAQANMTAADQIDAVIGKGTRFDGSDDQITFANKIGRASCRERV